MSLCKLFGVELCTLFGVLFEYGPIGGAHGRGPKVRPLKAVAAAAEIPFRTAQQWVSLYWHHDFISVMASRSLALTLALAAWPASAQLPASSTLSDIDRPLFRAEIAPVEKLLPSAPDKATVTYEMARTFAFAKQWPETIQWLRKAVERRVGLDPSRESIFAELHGTREFEEILAIVREATEVVSHSSPAFQVAEGDLAPESVAYDPNGKEFYFGSMKKGKVVRCSPSGYCTQFAGGLGTVDRKSVV